MLNSIDAPPRTPNDRIDAVTNASFDAEISKGVGPIVVEFMTFGCSHCRTLEPILQQVADMTRSKGKIFRVNVAAEAELAKKYQIVSTPTLLLFLDGKQVGRVEGPTPTVASVLTAVTRPFRAAQRVSS